MCRETTQFEWESKSRALPVYFVDVDMRGHVLLQCSEMVGILGLQRAHQNLKLR
jgi:hypothetical protein